MLIFETVRVLAIPTSILVVFQISICSRMILRLSRTYRANCCWLIYSSSSCILDRSHLQSVLDSRAALLPQGLHLLEQVMSQMRRNRALRNPCRTGTASHSVSLPCHPYKLTSSFHFRLSYIRQLSGSGLCS